MSKITVVNEKYEFKDIDLILTFKLENNTREYVLYSINNGENVNICVSYINKTEDGHDELKDILDANEKKLVIDALKRILKGEAICEWL